MHSRSIKKSMIANGLLTAYRWGTKKGNDGGGFKKALKKFFFWKGDSSRDGGGWCLRGRGSRCGGKGCRDRSKW